MKLSATLYLPPGYKKGDRLPVIMWAYPREFGDPDSASQITGSPNRFTIVSGYSHLFLLLSGYAILDNPAMPIVGPGETHRDRGRIHRPDLEEQWAPGVGTGQHRGEARHRGIVDVEVAQADRVVHPQVPAEQGAPTGTGRRPASARVTVPAPSRTSIRQGPSL